LTTPLDISLRAESDQDLEFLLEVYASTRADELGLVPWTAEQKDAFLKMQFSAQRNYYRERFSHAEFQVILLGDERVGRLYVLREDGMTRILDITVLPAYRSRSIGTFLLNRILAEGSPVQIYVESYNRSLGLFERLGFQRKEEEGINFLMEWQPPQ
jgi:ribosomal protein S18 acetylase RimI-like enzyme